MDLLPRNEKEFTDPLYWKRFFEHCDTSFEWYGSYAKLSPVLEKYMRPSDAILQIGCGNSTLAEQLHDNGFRNVHSIDTDAQVITQQKKKHSETRPSLKFEQRSAADIGLPDVSVNVVVDKGTLDALLPSAECCAIAGNFTDDDGNINDDLVTSMFREIDRCLTPFGRYIVITLAQQHIVQRLFAYFGTNKFMIRVQTCDRTNADFAMPVFAIIITKLKTALAERRPTEFVGAFADGGQPPPPEQLNTLDKVLERICAAQQMNWFRHFISRGPVDETSVKICSLDGAERYELIVVDDKELKTMCKYGAFVVPFGRENDWLFATKKGRTILRKNCELHRIVIVRLSRAQKYGTLEDIQRELNAFILDFMPKACAGQKINFLSLGSADVTEQIASGDSAISGKWTVEHVQIEQSVRRRLVFMGSSNLVQSEVEVVKKSSKGNDHWQIDWSDLSCEHHKMMLTGLELLPTPGGLMSALEKPLRFALLGLGGGILAKFVHDKFKQSEIVAVELDSDVLSIAQKHFEFPISNGPDRIKVVICDAIDFVREHSEEDSPKFDVLLVDLSGTVGKHGIYCPPPQFVTDETLSLMRKCLVKNGGVLSLNLVTRDEAAADVVKRTLSTIFSDVYSIKGDEDINEVLICSSTANVPAIAALRLNEGEPTKKRKTSKRNQPPPTKAKIDDAKHEPWMKECIGYLEKIKKCVHHP